MSVTDTLREKGYELEPFDDVFNGRFLVAQRTGNLVYTAGQVPVWGGQEIKGQLGTDLTVEEGREAAKLCTLNNLRAILTVVPSLEQITRFVKVLGMVNVAPGFTDTPGVIDGCSEFLREVFGETGKHARSAVGMTLPYGFAVEIELVVEVA